MARTKGSKNKMKRWPVILACAGVIRFDNVVGEVIASNIRTARKLAREVHGEFAVLGKPQVMSHAAIDTAS